jgi:DNA-binding NarL/FixJ family response regulator
LALVTVLERAMRKIRVLVANYPRLMRDLVLATVSDQPDIEVLGALDDESQIAKVVAETHPDFVIVGLARPNERPAICDYLLSRYPLVKVLAVAPEHDNTVFFWSDIRSAAIESSEESILKVIRGKSNNRFERVM